MTLGATTLHVLRFKIGDEKFWTTPRTFLERYKFALRVFKKDFVHFGAVFNR